MSPLRSQTPATVYPHVRTSDVQGEQHMLPTFSSQREKRTEMEKQKDRNTKPQAHRPGARSFYISYPEAEFNGLFPDLECVKYSGLNPMVY